MSNDVCENIEGFILAGGASRRMGKPKYKLMIGGEAFIERAAQSLGIVSSGNLTIVGEIEDEYFIKAAEATVPHKIPKIPDISVKHDAEENKAVRGALVGLYTALKVARSDWIAVLACDLPFVTKDLIRHLASYCSKTFDAVVPMQPDGRIQPLCAFYRPDKCLPVVEAQIAANDLRMQQIVARLNTRFVEFKEIDGLPGSANFFLNVNRPEDHDRAVEIADRLRLSAEKILPE